VESISQTQIPGGWSDREIAIGPHLFRLWTPTDPDAVLEKLEEPGAGARPQFVDPYWAKLWPAAPLLAEAIVRNPPPQGTQVLELGCGSGLVGIAALACGLEVTFSDYVPFAVQLALDNARRNGFSQGRGVMLDWRSNVNPFPERFPFIVAADVTYDRMNLEPLLNVAGGTLAPGGEAWFGDAGRGPAEEFVVRASDRGWKVKLFDEQDHLIAAPVIGRFQRMVLRK
jgi:predicted nicotinamide N-methyase